MADPLTITASVAGIISLADVVFTRIYKYAKAAGSAQKDVRDLAEEVKTIRDLLRALSSLASKLDAIPVITTFNLSYVKTCQETLQRVEDGLSKAQADFEKSKLRRFQRKLKWPFTAAETRELLNNLARQKGNIGLSLGTDCVSLILSELPRLNQLETSVTQISNDIQNMSVGVQNVLNNARLVDPYFKRVVIRSFTEVDPQARLNMNLAQVAAGTHRQTFDMPVFRDWLNKPGSKLGITGIPGAGKTMLAGCLVHEALRRRTIEAGVAYFYCDFTDARTQSLVQILGTLAAQLADQSNEAYECLQRYYKRLHPLQANAVAKTPTVINMVSILQEITECFERVSIIIDGLDECGDECGAVADVLTSAGNVSNISMALLSRNEYRIFEHFRDADRWELESNLDDIRTYVEEEIEMRIQSQRVHVVNPQVKEEIVEALVIGAHGMYRWVVCQLDMLCVLQTDEAILAALHKLPSTLIETYRRIVEFQGTTQKERATMRMVLHLIAFHEPRLTIGEICDHCEASETPSIPLTEQRILSLGSSFIRKSDDGNYFELTHFTVKEFLSHEEQRIIFTSCSLSGCKNRACSY